MFKAHHLSALIAVSLFTSSLSAWVQKSAFEQPPEPVDTHFPLNPSQSWALEESLLVWKTFEDDTDYALHHSNTQKNLPHVFVKDTPKHPGFDWSTGVRVAVTHYLSSSDPWDVNLIATYFYDQADDDTHVNFLVDSPGNNFLYSTMDTTLVGFASKAEMFTHMNFFTFDLTAGRYYSLTKKIDIHPFIGVRTVLNYQTFKMSFTNTPGFFANPTVVKSQIKGDHDFWGVGPRIGTDIALHIGRRWSLKGTFGASLFGGRIDVSEKSKGQLSAATSGITAPYHDKLEDKDTVLRSNIDASLGLGWEKWVKKNTVRIAPSLVFEVSEWFSMKRWIDSNISTFSFETGAQPVIFPHRRYSNLGLMGFNINLKVDF
ncbi:MAG: hypothetical protein KBA81_06980 [Rhabdochlamydiaceae bacterium]|nr:hypothetical protein [Rhabdochlamydiaceae bacterium]